MLPQFRLGTEVLQLVEGLNEQEVKSLRGVMIGVRTSPVHYLSVRVDDLQLSPLPHKPLSTDYPISISPAHVSDRLLLDSLQQEIAHRESIEPLHLWKTTCSFHKDLVPGVLRVHMKVVYPDVSLQFTPIAPLKIVSTPLSVQLLKEKRTSGNYMSGVLAMDRGKRVVLLLPGDPLVSRYPMVGVWASNLPALPSTPQKSQSSPYLHPLTWSSTIHYLHLSATHTRISPDPSNNVILFLYIEGNSARFFEINTENESGWKTIETDKRIDVKSAVVIGFSREEEKIRELPTTEIRKITRNPSIPIITNIPEDRKFPYKKQITCRPAQSQAVSPLLSPRSSVDHSPLIRKSSRDGNEKRREYVRKSAEEAVVMGVKMRNLKANEAESPVKPDLQIPRIRYESESDSSDEETTERIQQKYLHLLK